ncbi:MAG: hypothetical protein H5T64_02635 [Chloroflexi bacterium]|nr:hypothetical protein [Chloroflexota bacterium]
MKKILVISLALVLLLVTPMAAFGQITYNTGFQVQNLGTGIATVTITFYNQNGTVAATRTVTIPAGASMTFFPLADVPDGFNGSVVISSNEPIAAIGNELGNVNQYASSYAGFTAGGTEVYLPLIMRNNAGFNTWFNVQNAGTSDAMVTVRYTAGPAGNNYTDPTTYTIKPGAARTFDQAPLSALGSVFIGSAKVTCTNGVPIVATVNQVGTGTARTMLTYNGFLGGSSEVVLPLINHMNAGYVTGVSIMNIGASSATVTLEYTPSLAGDPATETQTIPAGGSKIFCLNFLTSRFIGSGKVTNPEGQPLVAVVNQLNGGANKGAAYGGFNPASATDKVSMPLIMDRNAGFFTGFSVMNAGTTTTIINVAYSDSAVTESATLAPGQAYTSIQNGRIASGYVGSATVTASGGGKIVAIVNELHATLAGDMFLVYEAFNY